MSIHVILLGGAPASGKSTVMKDVMVQVGEGCAHEGKLGDVQSVIFKTKKVAILGSYKKEFGGTDALSMSIQPQVISLLEYMNTSTDWDGWVILAEGDRLFNGKFMGDLGFKNIDHSVIAVFADDEVTELRQDMRGNKQDKKWLKGRATKVMSLSEVWEIPNYPNNNADDLNAVVKIIMNKIREMQGK